MNYTTKIALAVALFCSAGATLAEDINPSWYAQPSVIGIKPDANFGGTEKGWGTGLKFGTSVHPLWDIQLGGTHASANSGPNSYKQTLLGIDSLLMLSRGNFRPYVLVGVGDEKDMADSQIRHLDKWSPYYALGLGFQVSLDDQWSLQADLRSVKGRLRERDQFDISRSSNKYLTVGLNYAFNPPPAPIAESRAPVPIPVPMIEQPAPAPMIEQPAPPPASVAPSPQPPRFEKISLSDKELFPFNKAILPLPQPTLDQIAEALQTAPSISDVVITGYTDRLGSTKYNQALSERRANAVRDYLIGKGIDGNRLKAYGKGEKNPVVVDCKQRKRPALVACLAPNRRVEIEQVTVERRVQ